MNYSEILSDIYVGVYPSSPSDIDRIKQEAGIRAVLNVQTDEDFSACGIHWPSMEAHYRQSKITVRRVPVRDFDREDLRKKLPACVQALDELLTEGGPVYVHCTAGMNRSPSVVICYLVWIRGWDLDQAIDHVMHCRWCEPYLEVIEMATKDRLQ